MSAAEGSLEDRRYGYDGIFSDYALSHGLTGAPVQYGLLVTESNRMICDPYPRLLLARDQVNQGAAVLLMSVEAARRLGVPEEKWVYLRGHADMVEQKLASRSVSESWCAPPSTATARRRNPTKRSGRCAPRSH